MIDTCMLDGVVLRTHHGAGAVVALQLAPRMLQGFWYYYRFGANVVWLVLVGWALAMGHLFAAIISVSDPNTCLR